MFHKLNPASRHFLGLYRFLSVVICLALLLGAPAAGFAAPVGKENADPQTATDPYGYTSRTTNVHLFEWKWTDIAEECENVLGPKGYASVQVSPPAEHALVSGYVAGDHVPYPWYQRYQTVSYNVYNSRSGTLPEFKSMIQRCHAVGVDIYVDFIINHTSGVATSQPATWPTGSFGSKYDNYYGSGDDGVHFPMLDLGNPTYSYSANNFNYCGTSGNDIPVGAYQDTVNGPEQIRECELLDLLDLDTHSTDDSNPATGSGAYSQARLKKFANDLLTLGVDGFRLDAAKHVYPEDIGAIFTGLTTLDGSVPYIYQEVIDKSEDSSREVVTEEQYTAYGDVIEFTYGKELARAFWTDGLAVLKTSNFANGEYNNGYLDDSSAFVMVVNHDDERYNQSQYSRYTDDNYELANVLMLAWPYGYPQIMSGYTFMDAQDATDALRNSYGPPSGSSGGYSNGVTTPIYPTNSSSFCMPSHAAAKDTLGGTNMGGVWTCQQRWVPIANMVGFKNYMHAQSAWYLGNPDTYWWDNSGSGKPNQIAFSRWANGATNASGWVVINADPSSPIGNAGGSAWEINTGMQPGTYCDILDGELLPTRTGCTGRTVIVQSNSYVNLSATGQQVDSYDAIAIHNGQKVSTESVNVYFSAPTFTVNEAASQVNTSLTIKLSKAATSNVTVHYKTVNITAESGDNDYTAVSDNTVTFTTGQIEKTINIAIPSDTKYELTESLWVQLFSPTNATLGSLSNAILTIRDNDTAPSIGFSNTTYSVNENAGSASIAVSLSQIAGADMYVRYTTQTATTGTPANASDYTSTWGVVTIPAGSQTASFSVTVTGDTTVESDETVGLKLSNNLLASLGTSDATLTIVNDDGGVAPVINNITPNQATAGGPQFTLTVNGSGFVTGSSGSIIYWDATPLTTNRASTSLLTATISADKFSSGPSASITVKNPDGQVSNAKTFTILTPAWINTNDGIKVTTSAGDNTGYEKNATGTSGSGLQGNFTLTDNARYGQDVNSGTATTSISCAGSYLTSTYSTRDQHNFYFNLSSIPDGAVITGMQVQIEAAKTSNSYDGRFCIYLSPNAGSSWSTWTTSWVSNLTTTSTKYYYPSSTTNSMWSLSGLTGSSIKPTKTFVLRLVDITNVASGQTFKVDFVAVKFFYTYYAAP